MVIYVDEMFIENVIMNYLIIYMTSYLSKVKTKWNKILHGSIIGAIYVVLSYIFNISVYQGFICKFILSVIIISISFNLKNLRDLFKLISVFYLITFVVGGASFGIAYLINIQGDIYNGVFYIDEFPLQIIVVSVLIVFILLKTINLFLKNKIRFDSIIFPLEIHMNNKKIIVDAFLDTGNNVKEPYTGREVIFVELETIKALIPYNIYEVLKNCDEIRKISDSYWKTRFRIIPVSTVGHGNQIFLGLRPDKIVIYNNGRGNEKKDVVIAVCKRKLSKSDDYTALIGSELITNEK